MIAEAPLQDACPIVPEEVRVARRRTSLQEPYLSAAR